MSPRKPKPRRRGSISKTKTGGFLARVRTSKDALTGKRGGSSKSFEAKADAEQWLSDEFARLDRGESASRGSSQSLESFVREFYKSIRKATKGGELSARTCQSDLELLELYVIRRAKGLAETALAKLTVAQLRTHFAELSDAGLARATVSRVHRILRARLQYALLDNRLRFNPMADPRVTVSGKKKRKRAILTIPQAQALFAVCPESRHGVYFATLIWTGQRPSEAAGMVWSQIDFTARVIEVNQALIRLKPDGNTAGTGTNWMIGPTKTGVDRTLPIPDVLVGMLRQHRKEQIAMQLAAGREYQNHQLVFCGDFGTPLHLDTITSRYLKPLLRRAALHLAGELPLPLPVPTRSKGYRDALAARKAQEDAAIESTGFPMGVGLYSLRHSFATRLDKLGRSTKDIQTLLGHANSSTTLDSYIHSDDDSMRDTLAALEDALLPKTTKLSIA